MSETRKLAAILAADVVGYSRLAGEGALAALASAYAWAGHDKEAKKAAAELLKVDPGFTAQTWKRGWARNSDDPAFNGQLDRVVEGLRKAGVPEGSAEMN